MPSYLVTWEIDVDADDPVQAALQAWRLMRMPDSIANTFDVIECDKDGSAVRVDLQEEWEEGRIDLDPSDGHLAEDTLDRLGPLAYFGKDTPTATEAGNLNLDQDTMDALGVQKEEDTP